MGVSDKEAVRGVPRLFDLVLVCTRLVFGNRCHTVITEQENSQDLGRPFAGVLPSVGNIHRFQKTVTGTVDLLAKFLVSDGNLAFQNVGKERRMMLVPLCLLARLHGDLDGL